MMSAMESSVLTAKSRWRSDVSRRVAVVLFSISWFWVLARILPARMGANKINSSTAQVCGRRKMLRITTAGSILWGDLRYSMIHQFRLSGVSGTKLQVLYILNLPYRGYHRPFFVFLFSIQCASKFVNTVYWACCFLPSAWRIAQPRSGFFVWVVSRYTKSAIPADDMGRKIAEFDSNDRFCPLNLRNFRPIMDLSKAKRRCGRSSAHADRSSVSQIKKKRNRKNKEAQTP